MCVKFHDEENRLEIIGGASCLYEEIQKLSIQNEDANFKGKTKPFTHTTIYTYNIRWSYIYGWCSRTNDVCWY